MSGNVQQNMRLVSVLIGDVSYDFTTELMDGITQESRGTGIHLLYLFGMQKHSAQQEASVHSRKVINNNSIYDYVGFTSADAFIIACGALNGFTGDNQYR